MTGKTLKELNVQVGDVVEYILMGGKSTVTEVRNGKYYGTGESPDCPYCEDADFRIISRATKYTDWKFGTAPDGADTHVMPDGSVAWRVKVEPVVDMVSAYYRMDWTGVMVIDQHDNCGENGIHRITFTTIDGVPDCASVKMEVL